MLVYLSSYRSLPTYSGVYLFLDEKNNVIYVGKAKDLRKRVSSYFSSKDLGEKTRLLVASIHKIKTIEVTSEIESLLLEINLIKKYQPKYNINLKDGKMYPSIKVTVKDKYPKILVVRKQIEDGSLYFGPYPSAGAMRTVLKILRRIFPYQSVNNHPNRLCLYYHLGLCPCPTVTNDPGYKTTIRHIIDFLNGNTKKIIKDLEKERDVVSKKDDFEAASLIQKKIDSIKLVTSSFYAPLEYENNPNLRNDVTKQELNSLIDILNSNKVGVADLKRIECYDISNTSGTNATGSMVVFINGDKDSSAYRRFKIRKDYKNKPNDFAMMQEVLERRLKHTEWDYPSLIIVDGGKGQISAAYEVLKEKSINIPLIGLAKREEIIITVNNDEIILPRNSKTLHIIMRLRDEAHRFAITYHRKLRSKFIFA